MENDEVVIDLRVLMWEILRKWHIILVVCIIFAIASAMFGIHRNKAQSVEVSPENLYEQLKPAEIVKVNNLVSIQKRIDEKTEYEKNSIYMSLNAYDVDVARTDFILSDNPDNKYIRQMYTTYMFEGGLYNDIIKENRKRKQKNQIYWNWEDRKSMKRQYFLLLITLFFSSCKKTFYNAFFFFKIRNFIGYTLLF